MDDAERMITDEDMWRFLHELDGLGLEDRPQPVSMIPDDQDQDQPTSQPLKWQEWDESAPRDSGSECYLTDATVQYLVKCIRSTGHRMCFPSVVPTHFIFRVPVEWRVRSVCASTCVACAAPLRAGATHVRGMHVDCYAVLRMSETCASGW